MDIINRRDKGPELFGWWRSDEKIKKSPETFGSNSTTTWAEKCEYVENRTKEKEKERERERKRERETIWYQLTWKCYLERLRGTGGAEDNLNLMRWERAQAEKGKKKQELEICQAPKKVT